MNLKLDRIIFMRELGHWLEHTVVFNDKIKTAAYRCHRSYDKMLEVEFKFGDDFDFLDQQLAYKGLPPIPVRERQEVIWNYLVYKSWIRGYWTIRGIFE